jgi:hypothetical protein
MAWQEVTTPRAARLADALEMYRKADAITRGCVVAALVGSNGPESWQAVERAHSERGERWKLETVERNLDAIMHTLRAAVGDEVVPT